MGTTTAIVMIDINTILIDGKMNLTIGRKTTTRIHETRIIEVDNRDTGTIHLREVGVDSCSHIFDFQSMSLLSSFLLAAKHFTFFLLSWLTVETME